eukprot:TRINITY_DN4787_c4_g1_i5.p1 TRINITY_DN4787_c4_g1~~TRINITY_DN4787_c4_g1_i5.p1  ORF type:complete len:475 (-),score=37.96 TRINITY_DN4787_c4_g1_i5:636-1889(-)
MLLIVTLINMVPILSCTPVPLEVQYILQNIDCPRSSPSQLPNLIPDQMEKLDDVKMGFSLESGLMRVTVAAVTITLIALNILPFNNRYIAKQKNLAPYKSFPKLLGNLLIFTALTSTARAVEKQCCSVDKHTLAKYQHIRDVSHRFLILIGAQKSGTSLLFNLVASHPKVSPPVTRNGQLEKIHVEVNGTPRHQLKEMHFFDTEEQTNFENYLQSFDLDDLEAGKIFFEATPSYILHTRTACMIKQYLPNAKFLVIFKDPVKRALSHYNMSYRNQQFLAVIIEQIKAFQALNCDLEGRGWTDCFGCYDTHLNLITRGFYGAQLKNWLQFFSPEQFLLLHHNETYNLQKIGDKIFEFANLPPFSVEKNTITGYVGKPLKNPSQLQFSLDVLEIFFYPHTQYFYDVLEKQFNRGDFKLK